MDYTDFQLLPMLPLKRKGILSGNVTKVSPLTWDERRGFLYEEPSWDFSHYSKWLRGQLPRGTPWLMADWTELPSGPDYSIIKDTKIRGTERWFDSNVRSLDDVFDTLSLDVDRLLVSSLTLDSWEVLEEAHEISDSFTPMLMSDGRKILSKDKRLGIGEALRRVDKLGFPAVVLMDLSSLGRRSRPGNLLFKDLPSISAHIIPAGGLTEKDVPYLMDWGFDTAIRDIHIPPIAPIEDKPWPSESPAPGPSVVSRVTGRPALDLDSF